MYFRILIREEFYNMHNWFAYFKKEGTGLLGKQYFKTLSCLDKNKINYT